MSLSSDGLAAWLPIAPSPRIASTVTRVSVSSSSPATAEDRPWPRLRSTAWRTSRSTWSCQALTARDTRSGRSAEDLARFSSCGPAFVPSPNTDANSRSARWPVDCCSVALASMTDPARVVPPLALGVLRGPVGGGHDHGFQGRAERGPQRGRSFRGLALTGPLALPRRLAGPQRPGQVTGDDQVLPAGLDLPAQQLAVAEGRFHRAESPPVRVFGQVAQAGADGQLAFGRRGQRRDPGAERVHHPGHGLGQHRDPAFLAAAGVGQEGADLLECLRRQHAPGHPGLRDHEPVGRVDGVGVQHRGEVRDQLGPGSGRDPGQHDAERRARSRACCSTCQTGASA